MPASAPAIVHVNYAVARRGIPAAVSFRQWVQAALAGAGHAPLAEVSIRLVDAEEGYQLNHQYRHKDYATNVLSFPVDLPAGIDVPLLGDLVICAPVVTREALAQNKPRRHHYAHLTVHGILHLLGFDHIQEAQAEHMEALERRILAGLGIPDPYRQN